MNSTLSRSLISVFLFLLVVYACEPAYVTVESIKINKSTASLEIGNTLVLTAKVMPENATDATVYWVSSDPNVASVWGGTVTAKVEGNAVITATAGEKSATCNVSVKKPIILPTAISLNKKEIMLRVGETDTLTYSLTPTDAKDFGVTWSSDNPEVASVTNGIIKAGSRGETFISAHTQPFETDGALTHYYYYSDWCHVVVKPVRTDYLSFQADADSNRVRLISNHMTPNLEYSYDLETWTKWDYGWLTVTSDRKLYFRGRTRYMSYNDFVGYTRFEAQLPDVTISCDGDITTLLNYDDEVTSLTDYCFFGLFMDFPLSRAPKLPTTELGQYSYKNMFSGCKYLIEAPELPATTLGESCYYAMFSGCTSLVKAPDLPASTLTKNCYSRMFSSCTSLIDAPSLSATILAEACYLAMFKDCHSLLNAPELPATELRNKCYSEMFMNCEALIKAPSLPSDKLTEECYSYMFRGCQHLSEAPALPAINLEIGCYRGMFMGCSSLEYCPDLPSSNLTFSDNCYSYMFNGCSSIKETPNLPATNLSTGCYSWMFAGCTSLTKAPVLPSTSLKESCYSGMFSNCSSMKEAPILPAQNLVKGCYSYMFTSSGITYLKALFLDTPSNDYTFDWVKGVPAEGTFVKNEKATWEVTGNNGIPQGWKVEKASQ